MRAYEHQTHVVIYTALSAQGRTGKQCRERWHNHLGESAHPAGMHRGGPRACIFTDSPPPLPLPADPNINKNPWTEEEERIMADAHR